MNKIIDRIGGDKDEFVKLFQSGDPKLKEQFNQVWEEIDTSDRVALETHFYDQEEKLWKLISSGKFPVPLPFASLLPLTVEALAASRQLKTKQNQQLIDRMISGFLPEDSRLYYSVLEEWKRENKNCDEEVVWDAVGLMSGLTVNGGLGGRILAGLFLSYLKTGTYSVIDEAEMKILKVWNPDSGESIFAEEYAKYLRSKGYPELANRTLSLVQRCFQTVAIKPKRGWWRFWLRTGVTDEKGT